MRQLELFSLLTTSTRSARWRLLGIAAGVMVGVALALTLLGAATGIGPRNERASWNDAGSWVTSDVSVADLATVPDDAAILGAVTDYYRGEPLTVVRIAATESSTLRIPGVTVLPRPGQAIASPAAAALIADAPHDELGARYGDVVGTITAAGLQSPDARVVLVGEELDFFTAGSESGSLVTGFQPVDFSSTTYRILFAVGALAVLIPVILLISIVTDLGSAQRAERFATLRLIGATPGRVAWLAAVETALTTLTGAALGVGLYFLALPLAMRVRVESGTFYRTDLLVPPLTVVMTVVLTVAATTVVAWRRVLQADIGPLGGARERREKTPHLRSLWALALGIGLFGAIVAVGRTGNWPTWGTAAVIAGFVLLTVGQLLAGPYLTRLLARGWVVRTGSATTLMALGRISHHAHATFRSVSGFVVAVYLVTVYAVGVTTAMGQTEALDDPAYFPAHTLTAAFSEGVEGEIARTLDQQVAAIGGVEQTAIVWADDDYGLYISARDAARQFPAYMSAHPELAGAPWYIVNQSALWGQSLELRPSEEMSTDELAASMLLVVGDEAGLERARTYLEKQASTYGVPTTAADNQVTVSLATENEFAAMAYIGIVIATAISASALAVAGLAGVLDRRRVLGLMRLIGLSASQLRRVLAVETLVPVAAVFLTTVALGVFTAWGLVSGLTGGRRGVTWPDPSFYLMLVVCTLLMVGAAAVTFRTARRVTEAADSTRFE